MMDQKREEMKLRNRDRTVSGSRGGSTKTTKKHEMVQEKEDRFREHIESRINKWRNQIDNESKLSSEEKIKFHAEIDEYHSYELQLINSRIEMSLDYEKVRDIKDADGRRQYLDTLKLKREDVRREDDRIREIVIEKRRTIGERVQEFNTEL